MIFSTASEAAVEKIERNIYVKHSQPHFPHPGFRHDQPDAG
jgi:hypothetical protein